MTLQYPKFAYAIIWSTLLVQGVWHANRGRILRRTRAPIQLWDLLILRSPKGSCCSISDYLSCSCICSNVETNLPWTYFVFGFWVSNIPWYFHFTSISFLRSLLLYVNYLVSITAGWVKVLEGTCCQSLRLTSVYMWRFENKRNHPISSNSHPSAIAYKA